MTVAGTPVNMPTHAHSQGYADLNFLIPELVAGVHFSKGPYFADQGDFATAGASNIFNLFDARDSDIDYYFTSRLPGEPLAGVEDIHFHPAVPRTFRVGLVVGF
jgi:hypothetical protein